MPLLGYEKEVLSKLVPSWKQLVKIINIQTEQENTDESKSADKTADDAECVNQSGSSQDSQSVQEIYDDISEISSQLDECLTELEAKKRKKDTSQSHHNSCVVLSEGMDTYRLLFYLLLYLKNPRHVHYVKSFDKAAMNYYDIVYSGIFGLDYNLSEEFYSIDFGQNDFFTLKTPVLAKESDSCEVPPPQILSRTRLIILLGLEYSHYLDYKTCETSEILFLLNAFCRTKNEDEKLPIDFTVPRISYISRHTVKERESSYLMGGIYSVSTRVLILDLLCNNLPAETISGIIVFHFHKMFADSKISFVLNLYRKKNTFGFIKVITDDIHNFSTVNIFEFLSCPDISVSLIPRYSISQSNFNENTQPETHEISIPLSPQLEKIQLTLISLLQKIINQLSKNDIAKMLIPELEFDINSLIYDHSKLSLLERRLGKIGNDCVWDSIKDDLNSLGIFSRLLHLSQKVDEVTFLKNVDEERFKFLESTWMWDRDALVFFQLAEERVFRVSNRDPPSIECAISNDNIYSILRDLAKESNVTILCNGFLAYESAKINLHDQAVEENFSYYAEWRACGSLLSHVKSCDPKAQALVTRVKWVDSLFKEYLVDRYGGLLYYDDQPSYSFNLIAVFNHRKEFVELSSKPQIFPLVNLSDLLNTSNMFRTTEKPVDSIYSFNALDSLFYDLNEKNFIIIQGSLKVFRQLELCYSHLYLRRCYSSLRNPDIQIGTPLGKVGILIYKDSIYTNTFSYQLNSQLKKWQEFSSYIKTLRLKPTFPSQALNFSEGSEQSQIIIVDKREFESLLPYRLHLDGFVLVPTFLKVGDYIISKNTCIERKSPYDLVDSLAVGRLFNQVKEMNKYYENVILVIEFEHIGFHLTPFGRREGECSRTYSKLITLCLTTNNLQLIWTNGSQMTSSIIKQLKHNAPEPSVKAVQEELETDVTYGVGEKVLEKIPGISKWMMYQIMNNVPSLKDLSNMRIRDYEARLGFNNKMAKQMYDFFNTQ